MYICVYYMAVIALQSPLESLLALEQLNRAYSEACLISCVEVCFIVFLRACLMSAWQSNAWELCLRNAYFRRSWVFHTRFLADGNLWVYGMFRTNVDKLNLLLYVLLVLWSSSPILSSSPLSPWASYHCHYQYQPLTEWAHIHPKSAGCRLQIVLESQSPKIQFSTGSAESEIVIVNIMAMRHFEIALWWAQWRWDSHFGIDRHCDICYDMPHTTRYPPSASWCLVVVTLQVTGSNTTKHTWEHIVRWILKCPASREWTWKHRAKEAGSVSCNAIGDILVSILGSVLESIFRELTK